MKKHTPVADVTCRFSGLALCMMGCTIMLIGAFPNTASIGGMADTQIELVLRMLIGAACWALGLWQIYLPHHRARRTKQV